MVWQQTWDADNQPPVDQMPMALLSGQVPWQLRNYQK